MVTTRLNEKYQGIAWRKHLLGIAAFELTRLVGLGDTEGNCPAHEEKWHTEKTDSYVSDDFFSDATATSVPVVLIVADDGKYFDLLSTNANVLIGAGQIGKCTSQYSI